MASAGVRGWGRRVITRGGASGVPCHTSRADSWSPALRGGVLAAHAGGHGTPRRGDRRASPRAAPSPPSAVVPRPRRAGHGRARGSRVAVVHGAPGSVPRPALGHADRSVPGGPSRPRPPRVGCRHKPQGRSRRPAVRGHRGETEAKRQRRLCDGGAGPYASRAAGVKRGLPSRAAMAASRRLGRRFCLVGLAGSFIWPPVERGAPRSTPHVDLGRPAA